MSKNFAMAGLYGALAHFFGAEAPKLAIVMLETSFILVMVDTIAGIVAAGIMGKLRSERLYRGLLSKSLQYIGIVAIFSTVGVVTSSWGPIMVSFAVIQLAEIISMWETVTLLRCYGGVDLRGLNPVIERLKKHLMVMTDLQEVRDEEVLEGRVAGITDRARSTRGSDQSPDGPGKGPEGRLWKV